MKVLVLFDIDRTILRTKFYPSTQRRAFSVAMKEVYGINTDVDLIEHRGMTDQQILIEILKLHGFSNDEIQKGLARCMQRMEEFFRKHLRADELEVLEGVEELLKRLQEEGVFLGLITGNLKVIAKKKLTELGLWDYFQVGAFGSDSVDRAKLVRLAVRRTKKLGFKPERIFTIGDTPRDVDAAKKSGIKNIKTIAVATGSSSVDELKEAGADFVFKNLKDVDAVVSVIKNGK